MREQQIQLYEQTRYSRASLSRLQSVADALKLSVRDSIGYHVASATEHRQQASRKQTKHAAKQGDTAPKQAIREASGTLRSKAASKQPNGAAASARLQRTNRKMTRETAASAAAKRRRAKRST